MENSSLYIVKISICSHDAMLIIFSRYLYSSKNKNFLKYFSSLLQLIGIKSDAI